VTFGCLSNFSRVSAAAVEVWGELLAAEPGSRMILSCPSAGRQAAVLEQFARAGVSADRVEFLARQPWEGYVRTYQRIDVGLDAMPCGGGITTCDSLWMGVPVITLGGKTAVARAACTVLSNAGVAELIARSPEEYLRLARDWRRWVELRSSLREKMRASALMDGAGFARDMEAVFREAWGRYCSP
jgi:protein O-GlcNAc transferase